MANASYDLRPDPSDEVQEATDKSIESLLDLLTARLARLMEVETWAARTVTLLRALIAAEAAGSDPLRQHLLDASQSYPDECATIPRGGAQ